MVHAWTLWLMVFGKVVDNVPSLMWGCSTHLHSHCKSTLAQCYRKNEQEKKRTYDERVREVEHGSFSPLVFSTSGGMGAVVYWRLASMMAEKRNEAFSQTPFLAEVLAELLATPLSNSMSARGPFITRTTSSVWCSWLDLLGRLSPYRLHLTPLPFMFSMRFYCILYRCLSFYYIL